jgi:hypothetical protein
MSTGQKKRTAMNARLRDSMAVRISLLCNKERDLGTAPGHKRQALSIGNQPPAHADTSPSRFQHSDIAHHIRRLCEKPTTATTLQLPARPEGEQPRAEMQ